MTLPPIALFIDARLADDLSRLEWKFVQPGDGPTPEFLRAIRGTLRYQQAQFAIQALRFRVAFVADLLPNVGSSWLRRKARTYADHPDFEPGWTV